MENVAQFIDTENGLVFDRATSLLLATETRRGQGGEVLERIDLHRADGGVYFHLWRDDPDFPDKTTAVSAQRAWLVYSHESEGLERKLSAEFPDYAKADVSAEVWEARMTVWPYVKGVLAKLGYPSDQENLRKAWRALDEVEAQFPTAEDPTVSQEADTREAVLCEG